MAVAIRPLVGPGGGRSSGVAVLAMVRIDVADVGTMVFEGRARSLTIRLQAVGLLELVTVYAQSGATGS